MSYRLINSNEIAIKYPEVNDMPCIYADLPNGLNGDFYDLSVYPKIVENFEQPTVCDIEQLKTKIIAMSCRYSLAREHGCNGQVEWSDRLIKVDDVLKVFEEYQKGGTIEKQV